MIIFKLIRKIFILLGYERISGFMQNLFRSRFATDMYISQVQVISRTHEKTFIEYKNKFNGKEIAIIATGPSLNKYKPLKDVINIGVNKAIFAEKIKLDFFFAIDYNAAKDCIEYSKNFPNVSKFFGVGPLHHYGLKERSYPVAIIPESVILSCNAKKYYTYTKYPINPAPFNTDIDKTWLVDGGSCIFSTMQFALFTNPKRIYLVGCDCTSGYFDNKKGADCSYLIKTWKALKEFADIYYPDTEIISVNPVGLKGLFKDLYQE